MTPAAGRFMRSDRLRDSRDYRRVSRQGRRRSSDAFVVLRARRDPAAADSESTSNQGSRPRIRGFRAETSGARIGITASRKVGNAVIRNRIKRRVREWYRRHRAELPSDEDVVVIARKAAAELSTAEIDAILCRMFKLRSTASERDHE